MSGRRMRRAWPAIGLVIGIALIPAGPVGQETTTPALDPTGLVDPFIGTAGGGNTFPGAVVPFGMLAWSPENTRGDASRPAAPGGYHYEATRIRGFSLTHLSGTGCRGASGDIPFMPHVGEMSASPSLDAKNDTYASNFSHTNESASPGTYRVRLDSGVDVELSATARTGIGRFTYPAAQPAVMLVRTSDTQIGSGDASVRIDPASRTITGSVTSGNFCGYLHPVNRRNYYTLYFAAVFDQPFAETGTWVDADVTPGGQTATGGTTYGNEGYPPAGKGSGGWIKFRDTDRTVVVRVGISYVSVENARANLAAEQPSQRSLEDIRQSARRLWTAILQRIEVRGGTDRERKMFYTALYHSLFHMNLASDSNGEYRGFDGKVHRVTAPQQAQYANFSGWDVYRAQVQLVALLEPKIASDMGQSLLNQANQNGGVWDRWTHNTGATHVMEGDPSATTIASFVAFGANDFDVKGAFASLAKAARTPTRLDLSDEGCRIMCPGQRGSLDKWLALHYIPTQSNTWGGAGATLETATSDFALAQLAASVGDKSAAQEFLGRSDYWRNVFNPQPRIVAPLARGSAAPPQSSEPPMPGGYIQNRNDDGSWPALTPSASVGFAEGSSVQYTWMIPFNVRGLFDAMGGDSAATARLDAFFKRPDGTWALRNAGGLHAQMSNEPSIGTPWLYLFARRPDRALETIRQTLDTLWSDTPSGIPGNDDLGTMSAWYVFTAMGIYPYYPGRADVLLSAPLFERSTIRRANGRTILIEANNAGPGALYITDVSLDGRPVSRSWITESLITRGGRVSFTLSKAPSATWGSGAEDVPPSFPPSTR